MIDIEIYRLYNDDLNHLNNDELLRQFEETGKNENRIHNAKSLSEIIFQNLENYNDEYFENVFKSEIIVKIIKQNKKIKNKLIVFIFSNCQGHMINLLTKLPIFSHYFEFIVLPNYVEMDPNYLNNNIKELIDKTDIFIYQTIRQSGIGSQLNFILDNMKPEVFKISMYYIHCNWYWLFGICIKEPLESLDIYKDKNITERNDIFNILNEHNFKLNERMEESFRIAQEKESQTDIKINQFIQDNYKKKRLFFMRNHMSKPCIIHLCNEVLRLLKIDISLNENIDLGRYNTDIFQPISSIIKKKLELEFEEDSMGDDFFIDFFNDYVNKYLHNKLTWIELAEKYDLYQNSDIYVYDRL